jgi:hypothetical protein
MSSENNSESNPQSLLAQKPATSSNPEMLTPSEIALLLRKDREAKVSAQKAFSKKKAPERA